VRHTRSVLLVSLLPLIFVTGITAAGIYEKTRDISKAIFDGSASTTLISDRYVDDQNHYEELIEKIPKDSRVLVATQTPHLVSRTDLDVQTLDIGASVAPQTEFPFFQGFQRKRAWLSVNQFDYVLLTLGDSGSCLFGRASWERNLGVGNAYGDWAPYVLDWIKFADQMSKEATSVMGISNDIILIKV